MVIWWKFRVIYKLGMMYEYKLCKDEENSGLIKLNMQNKG